MNKEPNAAHPTVAADAAAPSVDARLGAFVRTLATQLADSPKSFLANVLRAITDLDSETQTEQPDERAAFDDREIADIVNRLRDTLEMWGGTQQIRERIADVIVPILTRAAEIASDRNSWRALAESAKRDLASRATAPQASKGDERAPTFDAKHVSLKQRGAKLILTLELDGVESASRYTVTPVNQAVVRAAVPQAEQRMSDAERECEWTYDDVDFKWDSACGESWAFNDDGPAENNARFCQGCGGKIKIAARKGASE